MLSDHAQLEYHLKKASNALKNNQDYSKELNNACNYIDYCLCNSNNIAKVAFEVERFCLEFDRNINLKKNVNRLDARLTGCLGAIKDLNDLQNSPAQYIKDYLNFQPHNLNAETTYTKEAFNSLKYLGIEKNANYTNEAGYNFYQKRQDMLKQGRQAFLKEKQQKFEQIKPLQQEKIINKNKGLER